MVDYHNAIRRYEEVRLFNWVEILADKGTVHNSFMSFHEHSVEGSECFPLSVQIV